MPIRVGDSTPSAYYVGDQPVSAIYEGDTKVWPIGVRYTDDFNRAAGNLGPNWVYANGTTAPSVGTNRAEYTSGTDGTYGARWVDPVLTDDAIVEITTSGALNDRNNYLILRANSNFTWWVGFFFRSNRVSIATYTSGALGGQVIRNFVDATTNIASGSVMRATAIGNTYTLYHNGAQKVQWVDSGNAGFVGPNYRYGGFGMARSSFASSAPLDNFVLQDSSYV